MFLHNVEYYGCMGYKYEPCITDERVNELKRKGYVVRILKTMRTA